MEFKTTSSVLWRELITVLFVDSDVYVNSRPSPFKRASITTFDRNKMGINKIAEMLQS
ncbi:TPA: hypothetical protein ACVO35_001264 [Vibrio alginolyticus]